MNIEHIIEFLTIHEIKNYTINDDETVDVDGNVILHSSPIAHLPIRFGKVTGEFNCCSCENLLSLSGAPRYVGFDFSCNYCPELLSLDGAPAVVRNNFMCESCDSLTSLATNHEIIVGGHLIARNCAKMTSLIGFNMNVRRRIAMDWAAVHCGGIGLLIAGAGGALYYPDLGPFSIIQSYMGRTEDIFECQTELIEAGYAEYAQL